MGCHIKFSVLLFLFLINPKLFSQQSQSSDLSSTNVIWAGAMVDVIQGKIVKDVLIIIEDKKIVKIEKGTRKGKFKDLIDLSEYTVLPGLIDCHTHLTMMNYDKSFDVYEEPVAAIGIIATVNAKKTLEAGFTSVRDVWGNFYSDVALRDAINKGIVPGPRMYVSGPALHITGGHGDWESWMSPQLVGLKHNPGAVADGVDEIRKEVRLHIRNRVDWIKVTATGGSSGNAMNAASYSIEEMKTAVEEAKKRGIKVAAHAHGADGIKNAVRAGIASIEHGSLMDDESIELMKKHKVYLVMDLLAAHYHLIETKKDLSDKKKADSNKEEYELFSANFLKAHNYGIKMAFGSDSGVYPHGRNAEQFNLMVQAGMKEIDAIRSATINAAELIGIEKQTGTIEAGKWADIVAVKGNPLEDITVLVKVEFVMKEGKVYKLPIE